MRPAPQIVAEQLNAGRYFFRARNKGGRTCPVCKQLVLPHQATITVRQKAWRGQGQVAIEVACPKGHHVSTFHVRAAEYQLCVDQKLWRSSS